MKGKKENITITLKKSDRLTMKFLDGKILSGEVTNIKAECAEVILLQPDDRDNIAIHHLEISATPFYNSSPVLHRYLPFRSCRPLGY